MFALFRALTERVKALFLTTAALDFEADWLARDAERRADLLRQADRYDAEGLHGIAGQLRRQAESLSLHRPLAGVLPAVEHLLDTNRSAEKVNTPTLIPDESPSILPLSDARPKTKKRGK